MANERVVKVFHAARQDLEIVWTQARLIPHPIFDTQVAAMVCGFGESVSYVNLVKQITGRDLDKTFALHRLGAAAADRKAAHLRAGRRHASARHLQAAQGGAGATGRLRWLDEEMAELTDARTYETASRGCVAPAQAAGQEPQRAGRADRAGGLARAGGAGAGRAAQPHPARRGALRHCQPCSRRKLAQLSQLRSLSEGFARSARAKEIVEAVKRGLARDTKTVPPIREGAGLPADKAATVELLRVLLKACAARNKVAPRLIADSDDLERLAVEDEPDVPALKGWRYELFGAEAQRLKRGEVALKVVDGEVVPVAVVPGSHG